MKIINVSTDIQSQKVNSQLKVSIQNTKQNEADISATKPEETQKTQKKARKTKGSQSEEIRSDENRVSTEA